jgi:hypothetical protein
LSSRDLAARGLNSFNLEGRRLRIAVDMDDSRVDCKQGIAFRDSARSLGRVCRHSS